MGYGADLLMMAARMVFQFFPFCFFANAWIFFSMSLSWAGRAAGGLLSFAANFPIMAASTCSYPATWLAAVVCNHFTRMALNVRQRLIRVRGWNAKAGNPPHVPSKEGNRCAPFRSDQQDPRLTRNFMVGVIEKKGTK